MCSGRGRLIESNDLMIGGLVVFLFFFNCKLFKCKLSSIGIVKMVSEIKGTISFQMRISHLAAV